MVAGRPNGLNGASSELRASESAAPVPSSRFLAMNYPTSKSGGKVFGEPANTVEVCALGQITACLTSVVGKFSPMV